MRTGYSFRFIMHIHRHQKVEQLEALKVETQYFLECIAAGKAPFNDGKSGLRVVKMLEACNRSLKEHGRLIYL